jgi:hypothetical protein
MILACTLVALILLTAFALLVTIPLVVLRIQVAQAKGYQNRNTLRFLKSLQSCECRRHAA